MKIWIDADSCPKPVKEIIERAAKREKIPLIFTANRNIPFEEHELFSMVITEAKDQSADLYIVDNVEEGDLVITRDIPLADELVEKKIDVLNDRGILYTTENIKERLSVRNFMYELREYGGGVERHTAFGPKEKQAFANAFDRQLRKMLKSSL
ncbi:MAG: YaiI/YqxD family protein [Spirochaetaceae bacterium]|nr:YaiI/YqxD family protein [Spirochaetaceae bacterium]